MLNAEKGAETAEAKVRSGDCEVRNGDNSAKQRAAGKSIAASELLTWRNQSEIKFPLTPALPEEREHRHQLWGSSWFQPNSITGFIHASGSECLMGAGQISSNAQFCRINAAFRPALGTPHLCGSEEFCRAPMSDSATDWRLAFGAISIIFLPHHGHD
jgi:hypothetical protein